MQPNVDGRNGLHSFAIRWLYRILAPRHPRGWVDVQAVCEGNGSTLWIHTHGMQRWQLAELEIVGVPADLGGYAHGLLFDIMGYMKFNKPIHADENCGGMFVSTDQIVGEYFTARRAPDRAEHVSSVECLRIVDIDAPVESGFPTRFFATHLCALGRAARNPVTRIRLLRRATELYPGDCSEDPQDLHDARTNPGNYFSWEGLGDALYDSGEVDGGLQCLREAAARWPFAAADFARHIRELVQQKKFPSPEQDSRSRFYCNLDVVENRRQVLAARSA